MGLHVTFDELGIIISQTDNDGANGANGTDLVTTAKNTILAGELSMTPGLEGHLELTGPIYSIEDVYGPRNSADHRSLLLQSMAGYTLFGAADETLARNSDFVNTNRWWQAAFSYSVLNGLRKFSTEMTPAGHAELLNVSGRLNMEKHNHYSRLAARGNEYQTWKENPEYKREFSKSVEEGMYYMPEILFHTGLLNSVVEDEAGQPMIARARAMEEVLSFGQSLSFEMAVDLATSLSVGRFKITTEEARAVRDDILADCYTPRRVKHVLPDSPVTEELLSAEIATGDYEKEVAKKVHFRGDYNLALEMQGPAMLAKAYVYLEFARFRWASDQVYRAAFEENSSWRINPDKQDDFDYNETEQLVDLILDAHKDKPLRHRILAVAFKLYQDLHQYVDISRRMQAKLPYIGQDGIDYHDALSRAGSHI